MKKIGTISLNINTDDLNYGAILHSYAFQQVLKRYPNIDTEIIDYKGPELCKLNLKYPTLGYIKQRNWYLTVLSLIRFISHAKRFQKFKSFQRKMLEVSTLQYDQDTLAKAVLDYDTVVCESDVIWASGITQPGLDPALFLALPSMLNKKRVAYSASMANGAYTRNEELDFQTYLKGFSAISCRESYAAKYVSKLTGMKADWVLDPVMLLDTADYDKLHLKPIIKQPYILLYFPIEWNRNVVNVVKAYAKKKGLKLVELSRYPWDKMSHKTITDAGVEEFLSLIKYANVVFSNSFHAVCFSILYKKDFYAFSRRTGKKIEDFCNRLDLGERFVQGEFVEKDSINYDLVYKQLRELKKASIDYIEKNIID